MRQPVVAQIARLVADRLDDEREDRHGEDEGREQQVQLRDHPDRDAAADLGNGPVLRLLVGLRRAGVGGGRRLGGRLQRLLFPRAGRAPGRAGAGAAAGCWAMRLASDEAIETDPANIASPATGPSRISSVRFVTALPFSCRPRAPPLALSEPLASSFPDVGDDCPPDDVRAQTAVPRQRARSVRDDVEDLPVRELPAVLWPAARACPTRRGRIWTDEQASGTPGDRCPGREFAMERLTASAPPRIRPREQPDPTQTLSRGRDVIHEPGTGSSAVDVGLIVTAHRPGVRQRGRSHAAARPHNQAVVPNRVYALLVGINDYGPDIESLEGCLNDVDLFHEYLKRHVVPAALAVEVLKNGDATRANIIGRFRSHLGPGRDPATSRCSSSADTGRSGRRTPRFARPFPTARTRGSSAPTAAARAGTTSRTRSSRS